MKRTRRTTRLCAALGLALGLTFACAAFAATPHNGGTGQAHAPSAADAARAEPPGMAGPGRDMLAGCMAQYENNARLGRAGTFDDRAFLSAMIPHHEAAIAMAGDVLKSTHDAQIKAWANAIVKQQGAEIAEMRAWLAGMGGEDARAAASMKDAMRGMMGGMHAAPGAPADPDAAFVSTMIDHHAMAVEMAVSAAVASNNDKVARLANGIVREQLDEIAAFRAWLEDKAGQGTAR